MNPDKVVIRKLKTGVPGPDEILGGGNTGVLFQHHCWRARGRQDHSRAPVLFENATQEHPARYFTVLGEPTLKMLRYRQQFDFFDTGKVGTAYASSTSATFFLSRDLKPF